jgi:tripartite-type tricarboxylate transporter receptor subunit TctC
MTSRRQFLGQASGLAALGTLGTAGILAPASAWAEDKWPSRPIRLVVPYPAGGSSDIIARLISKQLGEALGQPIVVDNRPGANGNIGAAMVAQAGTTTTRCCCATSARWRSARRSTRNSPSIRTRTSRA